MARHSRLNWLERAWAWFWETFVWIPKNWYHSKQWTIADSLLLILVMGLLGIVIGLAISYG